MEKSMFWHLSCETKTNSTFLPRFPAWRPVSFCQGIDSILNFQAVKAAKADPVTIGWQRLCHCQTLKHLKLDSSRKLQNFQILFQWRICFCFEPKHWKAEPGIGIAAKGAGNAQVQEYSKVQQPWVVQICAVGWYLVFLDSTSSARMQISCISYGGRIIPPTQGLLWTLDHV